MGSDQGNDQAAKGTPGPDSGGTAPAAPADDRRAGGRRRSVLVATAVAAAVLLAGGGGAYLASASAGGGKDTDSSSEGAPDPLRLDGYSRQGGNPETTPALHTAGPLPKGPQRAKVYNAEGEVSHGDVAALAKALGVKGTPKRQGGVWHVGAKRPGGASLQVNREAPGFWRFSADGRMTGCTLPGRPRQGTVAQCASPDRPVSSDGAEGGAPGQGRGAPSVQQARRAAAPVFKAVGLGDAKPEAGVAAGTLRTVSVRPRVGGLPTLGWETAVEVGPKGPVAAHGTLLDLSPGEEYPVVSAEEALRALRKGPAPAQAEIAPCLPNRPGGPKASAEPALPADPERIKPDTGGPGKGDPIAPCVAPAMAPKTVHKAEFGLSSQSVDGKPALVPSWLFTVGAKGSADTRVVAQVAVDPRYIAESERPGAPDRPEPAPAGPAATVPVTSYSAEGRTLTVRFWGGVCHVHSVTAKESDGQVKVTVTSKEKKPGQVCILIAKEFTRTVRLDAPLGDRKVIDAATGKSVPRAG